MMLATSNDVYPLSWSLRSSFMELRLEEYTYEEFIEIVRKVLKKMYLLPETYRKKLHSLIHCLTMYKIGPSFKSVFWQYDLFDPTQFGLKPIKLCNLLQEIKQLNQTELYYLLLAINNLPQIN
jgi:hypothetical protein